MNELLGLPLEAALQKLEAAGISPVRVIRSFAPRRQDGMGHWRVVRVREEGRALVVCAFVDEIQTPQEVLHGALETQAPTGLDTGAQ
ncbi:MAG TPA: hypothetical protein PKE04_05575 [Clostridia bacterium]|nr:hypothetical protein [Clostridia bacterium]